MMDEFRDNPLKGIKNKWNRKKQMDVAKANMSNEKKLLKQISADGDGAMFQHISVRFTWLQPDHHRKKEMQHQLMEYAFANNFTFIAINFCKSFHFVSVCSNRLSLPFFFLALSFSRFQLPSLSLCSSVFLSLSVVLSFSLRLISLCG